MAPEYKSLRRGDCLRIRFGSKASQAAIVADVTRAGNVRVFKFSATRKRWKGPIRLYDGEVISREPVERVRAILHLPDVYGDSLPVQFRELR